MKVLFVCIMPKARLQQMFSSFKTKQTEKEHQPIIEIR